MKNTMARKRPAMPDVLRHSLDRIAIRIAIRSKRPLPLASEILDKQALGPPLPAWDRPWAKR